MPLPKAKDFREKTEEELAKDLANFGKEIATLPDTKYGRKQSLRKLVARILTVVNERIRAQKAKMPKQTAKKAIKPKRPKPDASKIYRQPAQPKQAQKPAKAPKKQAQKPKTAAKAKK
jgi:ribosomal protein L29